MTSNGFSCLFTWIHLLKEWYNVPWICICFTNALVDKWKHISLIMILGETWWTCFTFNEGAKCRWYKGKIVVSFYSWFCWRVAAIVVGNVDNEDVYDVNYYHCWYVVVAAFVELTLIRRINRSLLRIITERFWRHMHYDTNEPSASSFSVLKGTCFKSKSHVSITPLVATIDIKKCNYILKCNEKSRNTKCLTCSSLRAVNEQGSMS